MSSNTWQERLASACSQRSIAQPVFQIVSDRRGGRTAWSSTCTVSGRNFRARFWYDGKNMQNAKEDAAELAYNYLSSPESSPQSSTASRW